MARLTLYDGIPENSPEWTAHYFWAALCSGGSEREDMAGMWLARWATKFDKAAILQDFESLDRPALASLLERSPDPSVVYARIIEGSETIGGQAIEDRPVARYLTLKWEKTLKHWAVASYGAPLSPSDFS